MCTYVLRGPWRCHREHARSGRVMSSIQVARRHLRGTAKQCGVRQIRGSDRYCKTLSGATAVYKDGLSAVPPT